MARGDAELRVHLAQMPFDGARAEEELRADLRVREAVARQPGDLLLLRRQGIARLGTPLADRLARGGQLSPGALGERLHADGREQLVGGAQLLPRIDAASGPPQPLPVEQMRT